MEITKFDRKLNKVDGKVYVIEEEIQMPEGSVYEAPLRHDNITVSTLNVYTGPKLTGDRIQTYALSTPSLMPWKRTIRIQTEAPVVYISYETDGDTVEANDVNSLQDAMVGTQEGVNAEERRALAAEKALDGAVKAEAERAGAAEKKLGEGLAAETARAQNREAEITRNIAAEESRAISAEAGLQDALDAEMSRATAKEAELQGNIDAHTTSVDGEVQALKAADTALDEKKADVADMNRELGNRYTKDQVYTKAEVLKKIEDLIGASPETLDTFQEIADALGNDPNFATTIMNLLAGKVDKETGKLLTSNDYTDDEKATVADVNAKKHTHSNKTVLDKVTQALLDAWSSAYTHVSDAVKHVTAAERTAWNDANSKKHTHSNKSVLDKMTQAMLDKLGSIAEGANKYIHPTTSGNKHIPSGGAANQILRNDGDGIAVWGTDTAYTHPNSGVTEGVYRSVTVNAQGHVTSGSNPTTLSGYGITDAAAKNHDHGDTYLKKGAMTWADLGGS